MIGATRLAHAALLAAAITAPVESLDWRIQRPVQAARTPTMDRVMKTLTDVGKPEVVMGALLAVAAFGGPTGPAVAREALLVLVPTNAVVEGVKYATNRARPEGRHRRGNASFPSSHAANAAALAWVMTRRWPRWGIAFWVFALGVAASRVYLNRHFLSDVLCGVLVGLGVGWLVSRWLARRGAARAAASIDAPAEEGVS